ncbi:alpha/beta hydrolase [Neolewinella antarctica]|uniref:Alpha-beta hydrolase superfamily lysophospholipase n=1 Tax=Neolewinella antarctica TaxID=442734 RepID=A0ABX0X6D2_9BACT|nr:alpha/beta hydrolase [Neolewinella antarctica]NJC24762.1 alpha-beta hydrolase superfamily lysophospholipase [Neolewinella antarctica]
MAQETKEFAWIDERGTKIYAVEWSANSPRAVMGIVHGLGEHCRRYDHLAKYFAERGMACLGYDRTGHGRSGGKRGFAADYKQYVDEVATLVVECGRRYPGKPIFLYGHSMGGQILLRYLIRRNPKIAGAIVSAPHVQLPFRPNPVQLTLGKLMRRLKPDFTQPNGLDTRLLSRDPYVVERYLADPHVHSALSAQTGIDMLENADQLNGYTGLVRVPTLLMHGDADGITSADASKAFAGRNGEWVTYKNWPGYFHELHNEPDWKEVASYVANWVDGKLPAGR